MQVIKLQTSPYDANAYLVDRHTLVDAGMDAHAIISQLEKIIQRGELETIILTHCHYDHSGGAGRVAEAFGAKIAIHRDDAPFLTIPGEALQNCLARGHHLLFLISFFLAAKHSGNLKSFTHQATLLAASACTARVRRYCSPGTLFSRTGVSGAPTLPEGTRKKLIESIKKLTLLDVSIMYPGHEDIVSRDANEHIRLSLMMASQY